MPEPPELLNEQALDEALRAFTTGPPGVLCSVVRFDSTPPDYVPVTATFNTQREDIARAIAAYLKAGDL